MASCSACGDKLTGQYCKTCGARAPEERVDRAGRGRSTTTQASTAKGPGPFSAQRIWRTVAVGCVALLLFGGGVITGLWIGQGPQPSAMGLFPVGAISESDLEGMPALGRANVYMEQGVALMNDGQRSAAVSEFRKALQAWEKAIEEEPGNLYARTYQGLTYYYAGDSKRAVESLQGTLEKDPNYLWAVFNLAWIYETSEKKAEALAAYQHYLDVVDQERQDMLKYAEQYELIDRQVDAAGQAVGRLSGGGKGQ